MEVTFSNQKDAKLFCRALDINFDHNCFGTVVNLPPDKVADALEQWGTSSEAAIRRITAKRLCVRDLLNAGLKAEQGTKEPPYDPISVG